MEDNIFIHDASSTWGGFIYQGLVAIYLSLKCINDKKEEMTIDSIGEIFSIELENCEDISIYRHDKKEYESIHQVKDEKRGAITKYYSPLVQLMLEKGFYSSKGMGDTKAYLHVSNKISTLPADINSTIKEWFEKIVQFNKDIEEMINQIRNNHTQEVVDKLLAIIADEPLKLNRSEYKQLKESLNKLCKEKELNYESILDMVIQMKNFLDSKLAISSVSDDVLVYKYENNDLFASPDKVFDYIKSEIIKYKNDNTLCDLQIEYIANRLMHFMRRHVIERHEAIQRKEPILKQISFKDIIFRLDEEVENYEKQGNILALRRIYEKRIVQYCNTRCERETECLSDCKIFDSEFMKINLPDDKFVELCYCMNPNCSGKITQRECLNELLNDSGIKDSVFNVVQNISIEYFLSNKADSHFMINNENNNALITAISNSNVDDVVNQIVEGVNNNFDSVSMIFDSDQLVTTGINAPSETWNNSFIDIEETWKRNYKEIDDEISFCSPKKPEFVTADNIIKKLNS